MFGGEYAGSSRGSLMGRIRTYHVRGAGSILALCMTLFDLMEGRLMGKTRAGTARDTGSIPVLTTSAEE